jgi:hypothetical protein
MTYFEREIPAQPSASHTKYILSILQRASEVWSASAPKQGSEIARDLAHRMAWKKQEVIERAFQELKDNHETNFFPKPAKWDKALKFAESNYRGGGKNIDSLNSSFFRGRLVSNWEIEVINQLEIIAEMEFGRAAIEGGYWGAIYGNGVIVPVGIAYYMYRILSSQVFILKVWPVNDSASLPFLNIAEFSYSENIEFRAWLKSEEFLEKVKNYGMINVKIFREQDIEKIKLKSSKNN